MSEQPLGTDSPRLRPKPNDAARRRYRLQSLAARLLPENRVAQCHRSIAPRASDVTVMRSEEQGRAWYGNLVVCNRLWECPVCAQRISAARADELTAALVTARQLGWTPILMSFTLRHQVDDEIAALVDGLLKSWRAFTSGREFQNMREEYFWIGSIRNVEVTFGAAGWHPHLHVLVFVNVNIAGNHQIIAGLRRWVTSRWQHVLERHGFDASDAHGVDVTEADADIAEYIAKFGRQPEKHWGTAQELGRAPVKRGRHESLTPFDLLAAYGMPADDEFWTGPGLFVGTPKRAGALFVAYVTAFEGRNQLVWSRGLRALLLSEEEPPADDALIEEPAQDQQLLIELSPDSWKIICKNDLRGDLLAAAGAGWEPLQVWLLEHGIRISRVDLSQFDMPSEGHWEARGKAQVWVRGNERAGVRS